VHITLPGLLAFGSVVVLTLSSTAASEPTRAEDLGLRGALQQTSNFDGSAQHVQSPPSDPDRNRNRDPQPENAQARPARQNSSTNTWAIFGFTEGSDTATPGERMPFGESVLRFSRRESNAASASGNLGLAYGTSDRMVVWAAGSSLFRQSFNGPEEFNDARSFGALAGLKYQVLQRNPGPVGLSLQAEPFWERTVERGPVRRQTLGSEFRMIVDTALIPNELFAAVNLAYEPAIGATDVGSGNCESNLETSLAFSSRVLDTVFLGAEVRYQTKYSGLLFSQHLGSAWFTGPTVYVSLGENGYLGTAWLIQFHGRAAEERSLSLDLVNYDRYQMRLKFGYSF
jgi:hypothetical protein